MDIPNLYFNDLLIPAGNYTQNELMSLINARIVTSDNKQYIVFDNTPQEGTTLSNCYYFHNLQIGQNSCLDAIYEVVSEDTTFNLVNYTGTISLDNQLINITFGTASWNGGFWYPIVRRPRITSDSLTYQDYLNQYIQNVYYNNYNAVLNVYSNKYYISSSSRYVNPISINTNYQYDEWNPIEENYVLNLDNIYPYKQHADNASRKDCFVQNIIPYEYFLYGQPCRLMDQFKKTIKIDIPSGIYTFSDFMNVLNDVDFGDYTFNINDHTITPVNKNSPMYNFMIETSLFNIPQSIGYSLTINNPLEEYDKIVFVKDNTHTYYDLKDGVLITKNGIPTTIPTVEGINVMQSNEKFIQLLQSEELFFNIFQTTDKVVIPVNSNYKYIRLYGYLFNLDLPNNYTVSINNNTFNINKSQNIDMIFTQPITITGNSNILLCCRVQYMTPV